MKKSGRLMQTVVDILDYKYMAPKITVNRPVTLCINSYNVSLSSKQFYKAYNQHIIRTFVGNQKCE